ncbi:MAG: hypothetical protein IJZ83_07730 [Clostridia bacterium]|nr:hypothetical protein [Clostridia bacterium]
MKKLLSIFLAVLMLCGVFVGCSKETPEETEEAVSTVGSTETEGLVAEDFGDAKGNPRDFMMLVRASRYRYLYAESDDADVVARASYERNITIEEMFNIALDITEVPDAAANWNTILTASTGEFDLACFDYLYRVEEMGVLLNILEMPELDLSDDYWYQGWNDVGTVNGQLYSVAGDASNEMVENMSTVFFNKKKAKENNLDVYSIVDKGDWTLEQMRLISTKVATGQDDGDATNDTFGVMFDLHSVRMANACFGLVITEPTQNGYYRVVDDTNINERNFNIVLTFQDFVRNSGAVQYSGDTARARETDTFTSGKSLFFASALLVGERMKSKVNGWEYGVIPYPKFEKTADYGATVYGCSVFGVPKSVKDAHCSAVILNALNYFGSESNIAAFYDKVVLGRVADSYDDQRMLELIRTRIKVDFAFIHDENVMTLFQRYGWAVTNGDAPASIFDSHKSTAESGLAKVLTAYQ